MGLRTQKAFAELLDVAQAQASDWENDRFVVLEVSSLIKLAKGMLLLGGRVARQYRPADYDRIREGGAVGAVPARPWPDIAVAAEGDALPDGTAWDEREQGAAGGPGVAAQSSISNRRRSNRSDRA